MWLDPHTSNLIFNFKVILIRQQYYGLHYFTGFNLNQLYSSVVTTGLNNQISIEQSLRALLPLLCTLEWQKTVPASITNLPLGYFSIWIVHWYDNRPFIYWKFTSFERRNLINSYSHYFSNPNTWMNGDVDMNRKTFVGCLSQFFTCNLYSFTEETPNSVNLPSTCMEPGDGVGWSTRGLMLTV